MSVGRYLQWGAILSCICNATYLVGVSKTGAVDSNAIPYMNKKASP